MQGVGAKRIKRAVAKSLFQEAREDPEFAELLFEERAAVTKDGHTIVETLDHEFLLFSPEARRKAEAAVAKAEAEFGGDSEGD